MAGEAEKKRRSIALGGFTRSVNLLNTVINEKSPISVVTPKYDRVNEAWYKLEAAHDAFIEQTDIDIEEHADGIKYLDKHTETFKKVVSDYSVYFKSAEAERERELRPRVVCELRPRPKVKLMRWERNSSPQKLSSSQC